jgi:hypothetical protein
VEDDLLDGGFAAPERNGQNQLKEKNLDKGTT